MENQENCFAKTSSEAIKSLVSRAVLGNLKKNAVNIFEGLAEFTQISFAADSSEGYKINKPLPGLLSLFGQLLIFRTIHQPRILYPPIY
mgnify:CR=1 FL=1